jgi:hypothetical protein
MQPKWHILWGFIISYLSTYFFDLSLFYFIVLFFSTWFFIDLDHVVLYIIQTKNFHPRKFFEYSAIEKAKRISLSPEEKLQKQYPHFFMHGIEFLVLLGILSFFNETFLFVLFGFVFHLILDIICMLKEGENILFKISQIYTYTKNKKARKHLIS